ncbi:MAG TPA: FtsX-like permease family protein [Acidimicrobiia bacterium]|nr:FtsX-like permease family protein [Acidimicrobiia bacterium]
MFHVMYIGRELRRRAGRTVLTALGLAVGVGLVIGIIGVSQGLDDAQSHALAPLKSVGTDILVTRVAGTSASGSASTTTTTAPSDGGPFGGGGGRGGGGFFGGGGRNSQLNTQDANALLNENSNVVTDLSKLGKAGTKFTHDFFLSATLISFPQDAVSAVAKIPGVASVAPGLVQRVQHETGTVPNIVASIKTGGQTYTQTTRPAPMTDAERSAFRQCLQAKGVQIGIPGGSDTGGGGGRPAGGGGGFGGGGIRSNPAFEDCLPQRFQQFQAQFTVPLETINQVVNPPSTDITNTTYNAAGVDPTNQHEGLVTVDQLTKGRWLSPGAPNEVLLNVAYANTKNLAIGSKLTINGTSYDVVGLVQPTLTGSTADVYFPLTTLQKLASKQNRVTQILVKANGSGDVDKVAAAIKQQLPGAEVVTTKSLADQASGSLKDAHDLTSRFGGVLAVIVLVAAFIIAVLLTLSSIAKRVREIGTLRAIGWSKARVVRQLLGETLGIAVVGAVLGLLIGWGASAAVDHSSTKLTATTPGVAGTASGSAGAIIGVAQSTAQTTTKVALSAPLHVSTLLLGIVFALIGGLIAGLVGSWRAARLPPAAALRNIG